MIKFNALHTIDDDNHAAVKDYINCWWFSWLIERLLGLERVRKWWQMPKMTSSNVLFSSQPQIFTQVNSFMIRMALGLCSSNMITTVLSICNKRRGTALTLHIWLHSACSALFYPTLLQLGTTTNAPALMRAPSVRGGAHLTCSSPGRREDSGRSSPRRGLT